MYYCQATKRLSLPGDRAYKLVTHIRPKTYYRWNFRTEQDEAIGKGTEIVREIIVCEQYYHQ